MLHHQGNEPLQRQLHLRSCNTFAHVHALTQPFHLFDVPSSYGTSLLREYQCFFSFKFHFSLVLTFLYVKYGRRHYPCGHVGYIIPINWYVPITIANAAKFAVRRVA